MINGQNEVIDRVRSWRQLACKISYFEIVINDVDISKISPQVGYVFERVLIMMSSRNKSVYKGRPGSDKEPEMDHNTNSIPWFLGKIGSKRLGSVEEVVFVLF